MLGHLVGEILFGQLKLHFKKIQKLILLCLPFFQKHSHFVTHILKHCKPFSTKNKSCTPFTFSFNQGLSFWIYWVFKSTEFYWKLGPKNYVKHKKVWVDSSKINTKNIGEGGFCLNVLHFFIDMIFASLLNCFEFFLGEKNIFALDF